MTVEGTVQPLENVPCILHSEQLLRWLLSVVPATRGQPLVLGLLRVFLADRPLRLVLGTTHVLVSTKSHSAASRAVMPVAGSSLVSAASACGHVLHRHVRQGSSASPVATEARLPLQWLWLMLLMFFALVETPLAYAHLDATRTAQRGVLVAQRTTPPHWRQWCRGRTCHQVSGFRQTAHVEPSSHRAGAGSGKV